MRAAALIARTQRSRSTRSAPSRWQALRHREVRNVRYQRPLSDHLLNKYVGQYDQRRRYNDDDERDRLARDARRHRRHDRDEERYERHAKEKSREQDDVDRHWDCPFFRHCWDSGMSRLPTIGNCPECKQKKKDAANVSVFKRLGPLPPRNKNAESARMEDLEELEDDDEEEDKYHRPRWCPDGLSRSQKRRVQRLRGLEEAESLESDLQKRFEHHDPHELMNELKAIFETHAAVECYEASKHFFSCMMEEGSSISEHMLAMTGHAKKLSDLGIVIPNRLGINRVLQSLPPSYKNFVMNYNMQNMNKELPELFGMLKAAEIEIKKEHQVLMVNKTTSFKKQGKSKGKFKKGGKKAATPPMKPKNGPKPDAECYYCKEKGHWKRNCSKYLAI
ncbi:hypothetical protein QYE76_006279 [Lolium multiflorum]|uniref:CCHC-type domain-containing protein n=1 Tax=Lolium multiflorum TaxID=4521 RepID=A0AAD8RWH6_LOLMU|nr:hypothetical protein QYE76_006279 [Lolium multiflorum]